MTTKKKHPHIVVIGGGTGSFTLLSHLKEHTPNITALVNMADDGGSTGVLRDELGVLPPGDVRQCLVALSESSEALRQLFTYRFPADTTFAGHSFGNLFLSAVEKMSDDFGHAVDLASEVLNITGEVVPLTLQSCKLVLELNGKEVAGQYNIRTTQFQGKHERPNFRLEPAAKLNPKAKSAIESADLIVIAPGGLYYSLIPALLVRGVKGALREARAPLVYVCNLVNKPDNTKDFAVHDYVTELERFVGAGAIDVVLYNTVSPSKAQLKAYALEGEFPVVVDQQALESASYQAIGDDFLSHTVPSNNNTNDTFIRRSLIRHDGERVAEQLERLARPRSLNGRAI